MTNIRRRSCLLVTLPLCHLVISTAFGQIDGVTLSARVGFDNRTKPDCWTPVWVTLENRDERVAGEIVVATYRDAKTPLARVTRRTTLEKPSRKRLVLYTMMTDAVTEVRVQFQANRGATERVLTPEMLAANDEVELAVYDTNAEDTPRSMDRGQDGKSRHHLVVSPEGLPDRWFGYSAVTAVTFNNVNPNHLNPDQIAALKQWVSSGGTLTVNSAAAAARAKHSWLNEFVMPPGFQAYGFGFTAITDPASPWWLRQWKPDREYVRASELLQEEAITSLLEKSLPPAPPRSTAKEWLSAGLAFVVLALIISALRQTTNRRTRLILGLGVGITAVVALALARESNEIVASECSLIETTAGLPFGFATTWSAVTASNGGTLAVSAANAQSTLLMAARKDEGASEFKSPLIPTAQEESFTMPAVAFAPRRARRFVASSVIDLKDGFKIRHGGEKSAIENRGPFRIIDWWRLGDAPSTTKSASTSADSARLWRPQLQRLLHESWTKLPDATRSRKEILCALLELPAQVRVSPHPQKHSRLALLLVHAPR